MALSRRRFLCSALTASALRAQSSRIGYREYARCLPDYLAAFAADAYRRRNARIATLNSAVAIREYQQWARKTFLQLIGPLPEISKLSVRSVGRFDRELYRVEKLVYESRPGLMVPANLYLPKQGSAPYPGVLFQMGHSNNGKAYALYQRCCQGLVQLGYAVLAFDPIGQGERRFAGAKSATDEHTTPGRQMLLTGETATGAMLWDAMRSLDVLASHPQVDPKRLASTGQSGGATLTMILAAVDQRLAAAAVSSGNTENFALDPFLAPGSSDDAEQDLIGSGPLAFDRWDMLWPIAPKPLLIAVSAHDFFGTYSPAYERSGREEFSKLEHAYSMLGASGRLEYFESPLPHSLSQPMRMSIYRHFERHLKSNAPALTQEPPTRPEADETLWCGPTGNTVRDFSSRTPTWFVRQRTQAIATPDAPPSPAALRVLLGMEPAPAAPPKLETRGTVQYPGCTVRAVEVATAPRVWAPAWVFVPDGSWTKLLMLADSAGRNSAWHEDELFHRLAQAGIAVCAMDVRGVGDLEPQFQGGASGYARSHQSEENYAWASLILGRSLPGQRTTDLIGMAQALAAAYPNATLMLAARDRLTVPALCATALESRIAKVYLARGLTSWRSVADADTYTAPLSTMLPGALRVTDLPQISRSIAPRVVVNGSAWDVQTLSGL